MDGAIARLGPLMRTSPVRVLLLSTLVALCGCTDEPLNSPYPSANAQDARDTLYSSFTEQPKHLDPLLAYSANEYALIGQIVEPPLQYHYLDRPYRLIPQTLTALPDVALFDATGQRVAAAGRGGVVAYTEYTLHLKPGIRFAPHPAFARDAEGRLLYHALDPNRLRDIRTPGDFPVQASRELTSADYAYQVKRLAHPRLHSPIAGLMTPVIVGLDTLARRLKAEDARGGTIDLNAWSLEGVRTPDPLTLIIRVRGRYAQFRYWLAMPFFAPMPWEVERFYAQPGLREKNIGLDTYPVGTGPYRLIENNPNRRMVLEKNPAYHGEIYPVSGEAADVGRGHLRDAGRPLPLIERAVFTLEKEMIPYWNKFLQGYYDASGIASDSFDQAVQFSPRGEAELTPALRTKDITLQSEARASVYYMGFNMLDPVVGGLGGAPRKLRQALSIAMDYEEYIAIFLNGRGLAAQGVVPPGIFGYRAGKDGINPVVYNWVDGRVQRRPLEEAKGLLAEAGYPEGRDAAGRPLVLYLDAAGGGVDDKALFNWYRKQFAKLGIQLVIRATDYNRFLQKMRDGNAQIFTWGWNADYPDPENFFFLLHGPNAKVGQGGENAANYRNPEFDALFEKMRDLDDGPERQGLVDALQAIARRDAPWLFGIHPQNFSLHHAWYHNLKSNQLSINDLKYLRIDATQREAARRAWNRPVWWPVGVISLFMAVVVWVVWRHLKRRAGAPA